MKGSVKWFDKKKGYGFITPVGGGKDIFVHRSNIVMEGYRTLTEADVVEYESENSEKGPKAVNVTKLQQ